MIIREYNILLENTCENTFVRKYKLIMSKYLLCHDKVDNNHCLNTIAAVRMCLLILLLLFKFKNVIIRMNEKLQSYLVS